MCGGELTLYITLNTPSPLSNLVVATSCSGGASLQQGQGRWSELMGRWMEPNRAMLEENLLESAKDLKLGWRFAFQQDNDPKHKAMCRDPEVPKPHALLSITMSGDHVHEHYKQDR
ncbi:hypothetical protein ATANTOWER_029086 [Ataeniobius toweri]|uniref:Uncharacterized protein n=1 Tax=Ataeniobius toweri TaxID=208326 RepID=A0ABU7ARS3_9TELE|nr:hypothetical protein [Ataeniobius toweri]